MSIKEFDIQGERDVHITNGQIPARDPRVAKVGHIFQLGVQHMGALSFSNIMSYCHIWLA